MARNNRNNKGYNPSRQSHKPNRPAQHVYNPPQAVKEQYTHTESQSSQDVNSNKWSRADKISVYGVLVSAVLAVVTFLLYQLSISAATSAKISANAAKMSADLQKEALDSQKTAKAKSDKTDGERIKREIALYNLQRTSVKSQIKALEESEVEFDFTHNPYLQVDHLSLISITIGEVPVFTFDIKNDGTEAAVKIEFGFNTVVMPSNKKYKDVVKYLPLGKDSIHEFRNFLIANNPFVPSTIAMGKKITKKQYKDIGSGKSAIYVRSIIIYTNPATNKKAQHENVVQIVNDNLTLNPDLKIYSIFDRVKNFK